MESESLQLRELVPADTFVQSPGWPWWIWALIAVVLLGVIILVVAILKRKPAEAQNDLRLIAESAYRSAIKHLERAGSLPAIQEAATACSAAIRRYLATVSGDPSLYETHEEFLARHEALQNYPDEIRNGVSANFSRLANLKYGKSPEGEPAKLAKEGRELLQQLHQHRPA